MINPQKSPTMETMGSLKFITGTCSSCQPSSNEGLASVNVKKQDNIFYNKADIVTVHSNSTICLINELVQFA